jgi:DNA modification methylase
MHQRTGKLSNALSSLSIEMVSIDLLRPYLGNARTHSKRQVFQIAASIRKFGFTNPVLVNRENQIIAGHGRISAAGLIGMSIVPVIRLENLTADEIRAYVIADNKLAENAGWDKSILAIELQHLLNLDLDFDVTITGFEIPEIDLILQEASVTGAAKDAIDLSVDAPGVTRLGDVWQLGRHRIICADALDPASYLAVIHDDRADLVFTDPPFNVRVDGHVSGKGKVRHREFPMASGEMSDAEFRGFLGKTITRLQSNCRDGALLYICMDWRHTADLLAAGEGAACELQNLCVWVKSNGGMGSFYRSQHELVFVFKSGAASYRNNIQLGRFGRNRTNVWNYPSPSAFGRSVEEDHLGALHPTVKPIAMVADAILDCTARGEIVLDPFLGSGTTLLAAERVGRKCRAIELDPLYVDVAIRRWQQLTGDQAIRVSDGKSFDALAKEAADAQEQ